ncbi:serpin family protein [Yinghuangia seranimata]|uniref:serpin family protein n=1 Tax=Yinghuangia seranimata TaxID=408067 RepID=UPI00248C6B13|nr:serpin family protein [Yinghuangia seranimata]MDI2129694.1 serpin family protein [Yinghuangia seranimata]
MAYGELDLTVQEYAGEIRELGSRWLDAVLSDPAVRGAGGNAACSPAGLWLALAAVACGALGDTAEELADLLGAAGEEAAPLVTAVARDLAATDALAVATGVWSRTPVRPSYSAALPDLETAELADVSRIDAWVAEHTDGMIERLPVDVTAETRLLLVNALAIKARWAFPFDPAKTVDRLFTAADGTAEAVPFMFREVSPVDVWTVGAHGGSVHVAELRCAGTHGAVVRFALGPQGAPPAPVMSAAWAPRSTGNPVPPNTKVVLRLPRFALRTTLDVTRHLGALGVALATDPHGAEFGGISSEQLYIDAVAQESLLRVAEEGVEAAAVSAIAMAPAGLVRPPENRLELTFDRPFACAVLDASGAVPLFAGYQAAVPSHPGA